MSLVVLTHAAPRVERIARDLAARGHDVIALPSRRLVTLDDARDWSSVLTGARVPDWVVFVSPGAIEVAFESLAADWPASVGVAVVGPGSAEALAERTEIPSEARVLRPVRPPYDAPALMREPPLSSPAGLRVLVIRGENGRTDWIDALRAGGATVEVRILYRAEPVTPSVDALARLADRAARGAAAVFVFTGVASIDALEAALGEACAWARSQRALAVHPRIVDALRARGWRNARVVEPGQRGLLAGIESG